MLTVCYIFMIFMQILVSVIFHVLTANIVHIVLSYYVIVKSSYAYVLSTLLVKLVKSKGKGRLYLYIALL